LLKLDPFGKHTDLPLNIYETVIDIVDNELKMFFIELEYSIATEEAERIGVDHIAKYSYGNTMLQSAVAENLNAQYSAINLLNNRINVMYEYVKCVKQNKLVRNNEILREIRSLCHRLPIIKNENFYKQYYMVSKY
jgi:COP9 signalosome complex subunit 6